jgi:hypothetical protein
MYTAQLVEMYHAIETKEGSQDRIGFKSLVDLFDLTSSSTPPSDLASSLDISEIDHFLNTKISDEAELCRRLLMAGCQSDRRYLRKKN